MGKYSGVSSAHEFSIKDAVASNTNFLDEYAYITNILIRSSQLPFRKSTPAFNVALPTGMLPPSGGQYINSHRYISEHTAGRVPVTRVAGRVGDRAYRKI